MWDSLLFAKKKKLAPFFLGKGSNLIFDDRGWKGIVIQNRIDFCCFQETSVEVGSGYSFSFLGTQAARKGLVYACMHYIAPDDMDEEDIEIPEDIKSFWKQARGIDIGPKDNN